MAIYVTFPDGEPADYNTAYNDNVWVFKTSIITPTVRFLIRVYDQANNELGRFRVYPTTANNGGNYQTAFFDPSRLLQSYISGDIDIQGANHNGFLTSNNMHQEYYLAVNEEDVDANGTYVSGEGFRPVTFKLKSVWNGSVKQLEWLTFDYNEYTILNSFSTTKKFLTYSPRTIRIDSNQSYHLYFLAPERFGAAQYNIKAYSGYNGTGSLLADGIVTNNISVGDDYDKIYFRIPVGTYDIGNIDPSLYSDTLLGSPPSTALNGAASYTIQLEDSSNAQTSERFTFNVDYTCSKYQPVRLVWLNSLGGYDAMNFYQKSIINTDIKRDQYEQQNHDWTGFAYKYSKSSRGNTDYNVSTLAKRTINTDYLTEDESLWMEDLATSPDVYQEVNNELIAVNINQRKIQRKTSLNDKLMQYTFEIEQSIKNRRQRG